MQSDMELLKEAVIGIGDLDCGDNSCSFAATKNGMRTNGGCRCFDGLTGTDRIRIQRLALLLRCARRVVGK